MAQDMAHQEKGGSWLADPTLEEKGILASIVATILIAGFYAFRLSQIYRGGSPEPAQVYRLWITITILTILMTIFLSILTLIIFRIIHKIRTNEDDDTDVKDERDRLILLKGSRASYYVLALGVFISMLTMVLGQPPLVLFNGLIVSTLAADLIGKLFRLMLYRRGF